MIQKEIDDYLANEQLKRKDRIRSGLWAPSMFGRCYRAQYWNRKDEPVTNLPDARTLRVFQAGHLFHDFVQGIVKGDTEVECRTEDTRGFADIVKSDEVVDVKSVHSRAFWYMTKSKNIEKDKEPNILQVMWYAMVLKKPKGRLVFVSKDDLCIQEFTFYLDKWEGRVRSELDNLNYLWTKELPEAKPRCYNGKECKYCSWKDLCKGGK